MLWGVLQTVFVASVAAGTLLAPVLVSSLGIRGALFCTGALLPLLSIALWRAAAAARRALPPAHPALVDAARRDPDLRAALGGGARASGLGARGPRARGRHDGVLEGDHGDGFYIVERGEVDVVIAGRHIRTLGPGESFGEIALLRDVPRTATILARTDVLLQRLDRDRFIGTVAGDAGSSNAADAVVGARLGLRSGFTSV